MSYQANYETAMTYIRTGMVDRGIETLEQALDHVAPEERNGENVIYLCILKELAKQLISRGKRARALPYIEAGLKCKADHTDLLLLNALYLWDENRFDEVVGALIQHLTSMITMEAERYHYEYASEDALKKVYDLLLPKSYALCTKHRRIHEIVRQLAEKTENPNLEYASQLMTRVDEQRASSDE